MAGGQAAALQHFDARGDRFAADVPLVRPASMQVTELVVAATRQVPLRRSDALDRDWLVAGICDLCPALQQIVALMDAVVQHDPQRLEGINQMHFQVVAILDSLLEAQHSVANAVRIVGFETRLDIFQAGLGRIFFPGSLPEIVEGRPEELGSVPWVIFRAGQALAPMEIDQPPSGSRPSS